MPLTNCILNNHSSSEKQIAPILSEVLRNFATISYAQKELPEDGQQTSTLGAFLMIVKVSDRRFFDTLHFYKVFSLRPSSSLEGLSIPSLFLDFLLFPPFYSEGGPTQEIHATERNVDTTQTSYISRYLF